MATLVYLSIVMRITALVMSLILLWPFPQRRAWLAPLALLALVANQGWTAWSRYGGDAQPGPSAAAADILELLVSLLALAAVIVLRRWLAASAEAQQSLSAAARRFDEQQQILQSEVRSLNDLITDLTAQRNRLIGEFRTASAQAADSSARAQRQLESEMAECRRKIDELRASEAKMRTIFETATEAIVTLDAAGKISDWSPQAEFLFGWKKHEAKGQAPEELIVAPEERASFRRVVRAFLESGDVQLLDDRAESVACSRDGRQFPIELAVSALGVNGSFMLCLFIHEITERKQAEDRLRHQEAELAHVARLSTMGELVAGIAHEINQPLHAISNFAVASRKALDRQDLVDAEKIREWSQGIAEETMRAGEIIRRLRGFVAKNDVERSLVDINEIVRESIALVAAEARRHGVTVDLDLCPQGALVAADRIQIQQVMVNLLRNAYDAVKDQPPAERRVVVSTAHDGATGEVEVTDFGIGLSTQKTDEVFKAFYTTKPHGMGMGLAVSRTIVESHGGQIQAAPNEPRGARFRFHLPQNRESQ